MDNNSSVRVRGRQSYKGSIKILQENHNSRENSPEHPNRSEKFNSPKQQNISNNLEQLNTTHNTLERIYHKENMSQGEEINTSEEESEGTEQGENEEYEDRNIDDTHSNDLSYLKNSTESSRDLHGPSPIYFYIFSINSIIHKIFLGAFLTIVIGVLLYVIPEKGEKEPNINLNSSMLRKNFPQVNDETWLALESGIEEVKSFNKPSVLFYLYKPLSEKLTNEYIKQISNFATIQLTDNIKSTPIMVKASDLNIPYAKHDYGFIINKYREALINNRVMVVMNLDEVDGFVAQAFHTLCDEVNPLVPTTLFMFTMQVESFAESDFELVERVLKAKWGLEDDIFKPLLTRITSIILRID